MASGCAGGGQAGSGCWLAGGKFCSQRSLACRQRRAMMSAAPSTVQCMPDCLARRATICRRPRPLPSLRTCPVPRNGLPRLVDVVLEVGQRGVQVAGFLSALPAALPPTVGRQLAIRRPAGRPRRLNASCLVKRSAACWYPTGTVLAVPQNPGAPTVDFSLTEGQDRDAGGRSSRRRRSQEASRCAS